MTYEFTAAEQQQLFRELDRIDRQRDAFRATATPELADAIGNLAGYLPQAEAHLIEPLGMAVANGQMTLEEAQQVGLETQEIVLKDPQTYEEEEKTEGGFLSRFQDTVMDGVKAGSRWTFAAANLAPQLVQNVGARAVAATVGRNDEKGGAYEAPETGFFDGWFASTDLGSMLSGKDYGEGFFIGEEALDWQREQAKRYRGTVGDGGWTFGRGIASTFLEPGTKEYNILSGLVDAGVAIGTPAVPFASQISKGGKAATNAIQPILPASVQTKSLAGLSRFGSPQIIMERVPAWLDSNVGQNMQRHLINNVNTWEDAVDVFVNKTVPNEFLQRVIDIKNVDGADEAVAMGQMRNLLEESLGIKGLGSVDDINLGATSKWFGTQSGNWKVGQVARRSRERLKTKVGDNTIYLDTTDDMTRNTAVRQVLGVMRTLRLSDNVDEATGATFAYRTTKGQLRTRDDLLQQVADAVDSGDEGLFNALAADIDEMVAYGLSQSRRTRKRLLKDAAKQGEDLADDANAYQTAALSILTRRRDAQGSAKFGAVNGPQGTSTTFGLNPNATVSDFDDVVDAGGISIDPTSAIRENALELKDGGFALAPQNTAGLAAEDMARSINIPNMSALRRETSKIAWMFTARGGADVIGDPNKFVSMLDLAQNRVWKTGTLMTGGYAIRNISESMVRSAMAPGIATGPTHPLQWILAMTKRRGFGTLDGVKWTEEALTDGALRAMREYAEATGVTMREAVDQVALNYRAHQTGSWAVANALQDTDGRSFKQGIKDQIHVLANDPVMRKVAQGLNTDDVITYLKETDEGRAALKAIQSRWTNKLPAGGTKRVTYDFVDEAGNVNDGNVRKLVDLYYRDRLMVETGGDLRLRNIVAKFGNEGKEDLRAFRLGDKDVRAPGGQRELQGYTKEFDDLVDELFTRHMDAADDFKLPEYVKYRVHDDGAGLTGAALRRHSAAKRMMDDTVQHFFTNVFGKKEALLNRSPAFRGFYYKQVENLLSRVDSEEANKLVRIIEDAYLDEKLETYSAWRNAEQLEDGRWQVGSEILDNAGRKEKLNQLRSEGLEGFSDNWARRYLGGGSIKERMTSDSLWDDIKKRAAGETEPLPGHTLTVEQVSQASKGYAMEETKRLFYNAAERSNFGDIMRIVSPFGSAWAEVMKAWYKNVLFNPNRLKNMSVTFRGIRDMDPDGDGKSFVYKDPTTGEMMFNYPFVPGMSTMIFAGAGALASQTLLGRSPLGMAGSGALGLVGGGIVGATVGSNAEQQGIASQLAAPVKSVNMALNVLPSVGPVVQIAANELMPDRPQYDDIRKFLLPYGAAEPTPSGIIGQATPSWAKKVIEAISADPENDAMFNTMFIDAYRVLVASGEFDMNDPNQVAELEAKAKSSARSLLMLRGIGQFLGPARPNVVMEVPTRYEGAISLEDVRHVTEDGNIPANVLAKTLRSFQDEDYDTANLRFLETFGYDSLMFLVSKTKATTKGLDASKEFSDWERLNQDFIAQAPNVYAFFADTGDSFSLETYLRHMRTGKRERRDDPYQMYKDAEAVVGRTLYRKAVELAGANPSPAQEQVLKHYKSNLQKIYPGYALAPYDPTETARTINEIKQATLVAPADNEIAKAAKVYFEQREVAIEIANERRNLQGKPDSNINPLSGAANKDLRAVLRTMGQQLTLRFPEFARMYDRALFREIDLDRDDE